ncbi:MAG: MFS transporter [Lautropia sp.]|nr:MFS transporter [Lautropia sp.]
MAGEVARNTVDVQALINARAVGPYQWLVFALCFLIVLLDGFDTAAIGYIAPSLMGDWGIAKGDLAPVLSAALMGMAVGALLIGPLSDRFGRKRLLLTAVAVMGMACLGSAFSTDIQMLTWLRFVTGLGLGAAMPNAVTLVSEYAPTSRRALLTTAMFCGFPLGLSMGGFLAAWMIPAFGWRSVLALGGVAPLVLLLLLVVVLPESIRYMVVSQWAPERIRRVLVRMLGNDAAVHGERYVLPEGDVSAQEGRGRQGLAVVFAPRYRLGTIMLYLTYFMGLVVVYALMNWMPVLFREAGIDAATAARIAALFPLGGIGALFFGWLMDRYEANKVIAFGYLGTAVSIWLIGQSVGHVGWLVLLVFLAGIMINTAQASMPALGAMFYPTEGRATGVAWMLGIGRFGGVAGSFLVGALTARQLDLSTIFSVVAIPGLIAALALYVKAWCTAWQSKAG